MTQRLVYFTVIEFEEVVAVAFETTDAIVAKRLIWGAKEQKLYGK